MPSPTRQHLADFADFALRRRNSGFRASGSRKFRRVGYPFQCPLMAARSPSSFVRNDESIMREPTFTTRPPSKVGIDFGVEPRIAAELGFQNRASVRATSASLSGARGRHLRVRLRRAAWQPACSKRADDVGQREEAALGGERAARNARSAVPPPCGAGWRPCLSSARRARRPARARGGRGRRSRRSALFSAAKSRSTVSTAVLFLRQLENGGRVAPRNA